MKGISAGDLPGFIDEYLSRGIYRRRINPFFMGVIATVTAAKAGGQPYTVTLTRTGETAPDGHDYFCGIPGYIPRVGDVVECMWRDQVSAFVLFPIGAAGTPTFTNLAANVASVVLNYGSDLGGLFTVTAGGSPVSSGRICTVTFSKPFPITPVVHLNGQTSWTPELNAVPLTTGFDVYTSGLSAGNTGYIDFSVRGF